MFLCDEIRQAASECFSISVRKASEPQPASSECGEKIEMPRELPYRERSRLAYFNWLMVIDFTRVIRYYVDACRCSTNFQNITRPRCRILQPFRSTLPVGLVIASHRQTLAGFIIHHNYPFYPRGSESCGRFLESKSRFKVQIKFKRSKCRAVSVPFHKLI